jgi:hypothetical protein
MDHLKTSLLFITLSGWACCGAARAEALTPEKDEPSAIQWDSSYREAMDRAKREEKMLLVYFRAYEPGRMAKQFEAALENDAKVRKLLANYVLVKFPVNATITVQGKETTVIEHAAFAELGNQPGVAIIDFVHRDQPYYEHVVTSVPLKPGRYYHFRPQHLAVLLDLPAGSLSQRTMVFAVRIHPEAPESTKGSVDSMLAEEAKSHCQHQAEICVQGHHNWEGRFHRISRLLPFGLRAQEVVAESWPHQNIVDAACDCVDSWRQSSGHWSAVRSAQPRFGYDIKRGSNGIWYATGLFGNRH